MFYRFAIFALLTAQAAAAEKYPTVKQIEAGLSRRSDIRGIVSGSPLPFSIPALGRAWTPFYIRAKAVGHGEYDVRVRLR